MAVRPHKKYSLGDYQLDVANHLLSRNGTAIPLSRKLFQILLCLVEEHQRLIKREEFLSRFWDGHDVYEENLTKCISEIRKALDDQQKPHKYIETVAGVGYRYIGPVVETAEFDGAVTEGQSTPSLPVVFEERPESAPAKRRISKWTWLVAAFLVVCVAVAAYVYKRLKNQAPSQLTTTAVRTRQLTTWTGLDLYPSFSPDGNAIAYSSDRTGSFEIYVRQLEPGGREIQITFDGQQNVEPAWSPDGRLLAYHSSQRGGIWLVAALGGTPRQIVDFGSYPAWSRDGSQIAFQSAGIGGGASSISSGAALKSTIWVVRPGDQSVKQITTADNPTGGHGAPTWSADGRMIVFTRYDLNRSVEVWSVSLESLKPEFVAKSASDAEFSADGKSIYVIGDPINGGYGVWQIRMPAGNNLQAMKVMDGGPGSLKSMSISRDGGRIAYVALSQASNLWFLNLSPSSFAPLGPPVLITQERAYRNTSPAISPDGKRIAYMSIHAGDLPNVWIVDADGSKPVQLTTHGGGGPEWTASGENILFFNQQEGRTVLKSISIAGGKEAEIFQLPAGATFPHLSKDNKKIVYDLTREGRTSLWTTSTDGQFQKELTFDREWVGASCWSPDSRFIAGTFKDGEDSHLAIVPVSGGNVTQLTFDHGIITANSWSPDGNKILFAARRNGYWNLYWISITTKEERQLTDFKKQNITIRYPVWSPLGTAVVFEYTEASGNVWLMELNK
jgi:Tol biopolymer transport system component/DNA-binding winged helix-turn-helix (wHTH) protein